MGGRKAGVQFRQSWQAYEQDVQESGTFEGGAEVSHSKSEGASACHMAEDRRSY